VPSICVGYHNGNLRARAGFPLWLTTFLPQAVTIVVMPRRIRPKTPVRVYLQLWRESKNLTQEQVGNRITPPVDKGTVSRWETAAPGRISTGVIAAYAEAIGQHVRDMYGKPDDGPSLDAIAADLTRELREQAVNVVTALRNARPPQLGE